MSVQYDVDSSSVRVLAAQESDDASLLNAIPLQRREAAEVPFGSSRAHIDVESFECCDVDVAALSMVEAVAVVRERGQSRLGGGVHLCNTYTLKLAHESVEYRNILNADFLNLADGTPLIWVARKQGHSNMAQPTRGPGLMDAVIRDGLAWGAKHYFYGSSPEVVAALREVLPAAYNGIEIVGLESPPFRVLDEDEKTDVLQRFADSGAHFVWVGLGTPKQDQFVHEFSHGASAVLLGVGAAFDFAAGTVKEAPSALHGTGLEWVFRLFSEPRRLARRYVECSTLIPMLIRSAIAPRPRPADRGRVRLAGEGRGSLAA